jgi:DNA polymerase III alpha subunit
MKTNEFGQVTFDNHEIISMLYSGQNIDNCVIDEDEQLKHNKNAKLFDVNQLALHNIIEQSAIDYHHALSNSWKMPKEHNDINIEQVLVDKLQQKGLDSTIYVQRLADELAEFKNKNMINLLKFLYFFMEQCKSKDIVTGIGRGSSVSSLVLHLLDVHHIDPIKYKLDYKEFLR